MYICIYNMYICIYNMHVCMYIYMGWLFTSIDPAILD